MANENLEAAREPVDIAEAFRMYNKAQQEAAQESLGDTEDNSEDNGSVDGFDGGVDGYEDNAGQGEGESDTPSEPGDDDSVGGSSDVIEPVDYSPAKQAILKDIQDAAIQQVRREMAEQEIELWSMEDIYERDENTGRVTFHNPDDPNRPFASRAEAQAFIEAMNKEVTNYFRNEVNKKQRELVNAATPQLQTIDYADTYMAMSETEQKIFNDLIEPYAITNREGKVIGFNVNLVSAGNTARRIAKNFDNSTPSTNNEKTPPAKNEVSRPAMDMKTGVSATAEGDLPEPKTIGEALKLYDQQQRKAKKGKR